MKDKLFKRRVHVNWKKVLDDLEDFVLNRDFWIQRSKHKISDNRLAYLVLLHYYDKKVLDCYRYTGDITVFTKWFLPDPADYVQV